MDRRTFVTGLVTAAGVPAFAQRPAYEPRILGHMLTWHDYRADADSWRLTTTKPLIGPYDSLDGKVLEVQLAQMRGAGIGPLVSWTGPGRSGDKYLELFVSTPSDVPAAVLYEGQARLIARADGWIDFDDERNRARFAEDMRHLCASYLSARPERFFRQEGRFVVMAWPSHIYRGSFAALGRALMEELPLYLVSTDLLTRPFVRPDAEDVIGGFAAVSAYGIYLPEIARELGGTLDARWLDRWQAMADLWDRWLAVNEPQVRIALPLQFAFDDHVLRGNTNPVWETDFARAEELVGRARDIISDSIRKVGRYLPWVTLASWSEHLEGSAVEPTDRYGSRLMEILAPLKPQYGPR